MPWGLITFLGTFLESEPGAGCIDMELQIGYDFKVEIISIWIYLQGTLLEYETEIPFKL